MGQHDAQLKHILSQQAGLGIDPIHKTGDGLQCPGDVQLGCPPYRSRNNHMPATQGFQDGSRGSGQEVWAPKRWGGLRGSTVSGGSQPSFGK